MLSTACAQYRLSHVIIVLLYSASAATYSASAACVCSSYHAAAAFANANLWHLLDLVSDFAGDDVACIRAIPAARLMPANFSAAWSNALSASSDSVFHYLACILANLDFFLNSLLILRQISKTSHHQRLRRQWITSSNLSILSCKITSILRL